MLILVSGGSGSGKSVFAENLILKIGEYRRLYIATMLPGDEESQERIQRHQKQRAGKGFETVERYLKLSGLLIPEDSVVLLECMSNLTANEMFQKDGAGEHTLEEVKKGILHLKQCAKHVILVTNDIFSDGGRYEPLTEAYLQVLGAVNQFAAQAADLVVEVVYGIPVWQKGTVPKEWETALE